MYSNWAIIIYIYILYNCYNPVTNQLTNPMAHRSSIKPYQTINVFVHSTSGCIYVSGT